MKKLLTALKSGAREIGEAVIDANSMKIYEQEIIDAKAYLEKAKESLTLIMADEIKVKRDLAELVDNIKTNEEYAIEALRLKKQELAEELAEKVALQENELAGLQTQKQHLNVQGQQLKAQLRSSEKIIAEHERQLAMVRTSDSVQKATIAISENITANNSQLNSAKDSLEKIRKRMQETSDKHAAREELNSENQESLESKLERAGIIKNNSATDVLNRLKSNGS